METSSLVSSPTVTRLVPFAHVVGVDDSIAFYALLGFSIKSVLRDRDGRSFWAMLGSGGAELMLARASGEIDDSQQAILFYMYAENVIAMRSHLLAKGLTDGQRYVGQAGPGGGRKVVFQPTHPHHMPAGELRVIDPDGYVILIGQLG